jgi:hypothetical protein
MRREWSSPEALLHWEYATGRVPANPANGDPALAGWDAGHEGWALTDFCAAGPASAASLHLAEVLALRLYTGKGFRLVNGSCRRANGCFAVTAFAASCAVAKLARAAPEKPPVALFRGVDGRFHRAFMELYKRDDGSVTPGALGCLADGGLLSTTASLDVASGPYGGNVLLVLTAAAPGEEDASPELEALGFEQQTLPASVQWISQVGLALAAT